MGRAEKKVLEIKEDESLASIKTIQEIVS